MKKYHTRPIDFTGCHPVIAEHLKRSEEIMCWAWDTDCAEKPRVCHEVWIVRYWQAAAYPYRTAADSFFRYAEPIPLKVKRIMPPERAIAVLIAKGWRFDNRGALNGEMYCIVPKMFEKMGSRFDDPNTISWSWPPCIIEEVEDDE